MAMTLREIAKEFDMTIAEMAEILGCSRQNLYVNQFSQRRANAAVDHLILLNHHMQIKEQEEAKRRFNRRADAIRKFERMMLGSDG